MNSQILVNNDTENEHSILLSWTIIGLFFGGQSEITHIEVLYVDGHVREVWSTAESLSYVYLIWIYQSVCLCVSKLNNSAIFGSRGYKLFIIFFRDKLRTYGSQHATDPWYILVPQFNHSSPDPLLKILKYGMVYCGMYSLLNYLNLLSWKILDS